MSEQIRLPPGRLTIPEFFAWVDQQPKGKYELIDGRVVVVAMAPGLIRHTRAKASVFSALRAAIRTAGLPCEAFVDGAGIQVDRDGLRIPDAAVNCGELADNDTRTLPSPVIVVEVSSPSTKREDGVGKFRDYFRVPSIRHYLVVDPEARVVLHHRKDDGGDVHSAIVGAGPLALDPPGLTLRIEDLFEA